MASPPRDCPSHHGAETEIASVGAMMISDNDIDMLDHSVWCTDCEMWLNGPEQFGVHNEGKKHRKNLRKNKDKHEERGGSSSGELLRSSRSRSPRR
jgi:hypothetical protein